MPKQAQIAGQIANRAEMAGMLGISPVTLDRWVAAGCPLQERGKTSQGHKFNSAEVVKWVRAREAEGTRASDGDSDAKRRHAAASAELKELELAERRGEMIRVEDVVPIVADELANVRSRLMAMPGRLAPGLVGRDAEAIEAAISSEVSAALSELTYA